LPAPPTRSVVLAIASIFGSFCAQWRAPSSPTGGLGRPPAACSTKHKPACCPADPGPCWKQRNIAAVDETICLAVPNEQAKLGPVGKSVRLRGLSCRSCRAAIDARTASPAREPDDPSRCKGGPSAGLAPGDGKPVAAEPAAALVHGAGMDGSVAMSPQDQAVVAGMECLLGHDHDPGRRAAWPDLVSSYDIAVWKNADAHHHFCRRHGPRLSPTLFTAGPVAFRRGPGYNRPRCPTAEDRPGAG
jgi:hypothetical protein